MTTKPALSLLEQHEASRCKVDVDCCDPEVAKSLPFVPHDMTSNQALIHERIVAPENKELVETTIRELKGADWLDVHTTLTARFHALAINHIQGRVLAQVSPRYANDKDKIIEHARKYETAYNACGISNDRFCTKIPTNSAGVQAAAVLEKEGIRTLATALFGLPQAIAAQQAGALSIAPYFNEIRAHSDVSLWPDVEDPATQHPSSNRIAQIRHTYDQMKAQGNPVPLIKTASCLTARECLAMIELGADQNCILIGPLTDLLSTTKLPEYRKSSEWNKRVTQDDADQPNLQWADWNLPEPSVSKKRMAELVKADPLDRTMSKDWKMASTDVDYLADGVLDGYIEKDEVARLRLKDALDMFCEVEERSRQEIQRLQKLYA